MKKIKGVAILASIVFGMSSFTTNVALEKHVNLEVKDNGCVAEALRATMTGTYNTLEQFMETYGELFDMCNEAVGK